jgi:hypothetical protein
VINPIEQVFAKFKTLLRKAGARTYEAVLPATTQDRGHVRPPQGCEACAEILAHYPPAECAAYLKNAGYA